VRATALAALGLAACAPAQPAQLPALTPGAWTFESAVVGHPPVSGQVCLRTLENVLGRLYAGCEARRIVRKGEATEVTDRCTNPDGVRVETQTRFQGDYAAAFTARVRIRITGANPPLRETELHIRYRRTGPCQAGSGAG
jgi:hypothetical protein